MCKISCISKMDKSYFNFFTYILIYLDYNKIGAEGAKYLASANWKNLTYIDLGTF